MYSRESMVGVMITVLFGLQSLVVPFAADTTWGNSRRLGESHRAGLRAMGLGSHPRWVRIVPHQLTFEQASQLKLKKRGF